jgi:hypothetical protein
MRNLLAFLSFAFFAFNAVSMTSDSWDGTLEPVFHMFQVLFIGLAILSLAAVEWGPLARSIRARLDGIDVQPR